MESVRNLYRLVANKEISEEEAIDAINKRCGANSEKVNELFNDLKVLGEAIGAIKETIRNAQQQSIVLKDSRMLKVVVGAFYRVVDRLIDQNKMTYLEMVTLIRQEFPDYTDVINTNIHLATVAVETAKGESEVAISAAVDNLISIRGLDIEVSVVEQRVEALMNEIANALSGKKLTFERIDQLLNRLSEQEMFQIAQTFIEMSVASLVARESTVQFGQSAADNLLRDIRRVLALKMMKEDEIAECILGCDQGERIFQMIRVD